ncbi:hypothetical protein GCM10010129_70190 [Streptomyces fumigatiscleroticus]|nr:hypothetical protein GCM10010129_70190 [Streptomyces fumigatiscleroticus]
MPVEDGAHADRDEPVPRTGRAMLIAVVRARWFGRGGSGAAVRELRFGSCGSSVAARAPRLARPGSGGAG